MFKITCVLFGRELNYVRDNDIGPLWSADEFREYDNRQKADKDAERVGGQVVPVPLYQQGWGYQDR